MPQRDQYVNQSLFRYSVYCHESWVMPCLVLSQVQTAKWDFCQMFTSQKRCVTMMFEKPWMSGHFNEQKDLSYYNMLTCPKSPEKISEASSAGCNHRKAARMSSNYLVGWLHFRRCWIRLGVELSEVCWKMWGISGPKFATLPTIPTNKDVVTNKEKMHDYSL